MGSRVIVAAGWLAVLVGVAGLLLHWTDSTRRWLILLASFAPYFMVAGLLGGVLFLAVRHWQGVLVAAVVVGGAVWTQAPQFVANGASGAGTELTIMQANILFGRGNATAIVGAVDEHSVDVLTLDELTPDALANLEAAGIGNRLPYRYVEAAIGAEGTGIWSRYPLTEPTRYDGFVLAQLSARAVLPDGQPVTVYAFHPVPPYPNGPDRWIDEMGRIAAILDAAPAGPVIVGADFNATRDHASFRRLTADRLADAVDQAGAGMVRTYPNDRWWPAVIGIDHVLVSGAHADSVQTVDIPGSDHKAIVATVRIV